MVKKVFLLIALTMSFSSCKKRHSNEQPEPGPRLTGSTPKPEQKADPTLNSGQKGAENIAPGGESISSPSPLFSADLSEMEGQCAENPSLRLKVTESHNTQVAAWGTLGSWLSQIAYLDTQEETENALKRVSFQESRTMDRQNKGLYGFVAKGTKFNVLFFRGSKTQLDWINNFQFPTTPANFIGLPGWVHLGFNKILEDNFAFIKSTMAELKLNSEIPLLVAGHSLGGAIATLVSAKLKKENIANPTLLTFGQPRVGDKTLIASISQLLGNNYIRFFRSNDPVPRIPPAPESASAFDKQLLLTPFMIRLLHYAHSSNAIELNDKNKTLNTVMTWNDGLDLDFWQTVSKSNMFRLLDFLQQDAVSEHNIKAYSCNLLVATANIAEH